MDRSNRISTKKIILLYSLLLYGVYAFGQTPYTLKKESTLVVNGSSNVSDWKLDFLEYNCTMVLADSARLEVGATLISELIFTAPVIKMSGGRGPIMDGKIQKALKYEQHPFVQYKSKSNVITRVMEDKVIVESGGTLSVAGVEKEIDLQVEGSISEDRETLNFSGSKALKMSTFEVERPTAFYGSLTTNDDIMLNFNLTFKQTTEEEGK
ncbi:YceI family protein [Fulvivirga sp. M361]|uniref:YceI family protein n=1 Tax=Fulvivirga sp. M361 TaxID=2594266 RepID=UPI00117A4905|nr:YceI family protein [Fulvivirga sp. M361]TRX58440.1 YceI family protein [Fulvivirga sp. M361]